MPDIGEIPQELKYSKDHEWTRINGEEVEVGITAFAAHSLGDVVFVELPKIGATLHAGKPFGVVESVKSVSELFAPVSGQITAVNTLLEESPELVNDAPYVGGWMIRIKLNQPDETNTLLSASEYRALLDANPH